MNLLIANPNRIQCVLEEHQPSAQAQKLERENEKQLDAAHLDRYAIRKMIQTISVDMVENTFNENHVTELMQEKHRLELELEHCAAVAQKREYAQSRVDEIGTIMDALKNHPMIYGDQLIR